MRLEEPEPLEKVSSLSAVNLHTQEFCDILLSHASCLRESRPPAGTCPRKGCTSCCAPARAQEQAARRHHRHERGVRITPEKRSRPGSTAHRRTACPAFSPPVSLTRCPRWRR